MYVWMDVCMHVYYVRIEIEIYFSAILLWLPAVLRLCNNPLRWFGGFADTVDTTVDKD